MAFADHDKQVELSKQFLAEWPLQRLKTMSLEEYTALKDPSTFTAWIERRLDGIGSIWGGSSFKFGIFARKDRSKKTDSASGSYNRDYGWYSKYGSSQASAFGKVRPLVVAVAEAAAKGDYAAIDEIDLGPTYKWKIAFHYQAADKPGVIAAFKRSRLEEWLKARGTEPKEEMSGIYSQVLAQRGAADLLTFSETVWYETADDKEEESEEDSPETDQPLNLILYGPPGTGKTFQTARLAVRICDGEESEDHTELMTRYRELRELRRIRFVTFHPSFSYEEFVEGIRPVVDGGQVRYEVRAGVLKNAVIEARALYDRRAQPTGALGLDGRKVFKMSLGDTAKRDEDWVYTDGIENSFISLGWADHIDFTGADTAALVREKYKANTDDATDHDFSITAVQKFKNEMQLGDLVLISDGNTRFRAVAQLTGPYFHEADAGSYKHRRSVSWLWVGPDSMPVESILTKRFSQQSIYLVDQQAIRWPPLKELVSPKQEGQGAPNCVLIIDEINRANLAKTFGELITLIESSKRLGATDEREVELAYSGDRLGIPPNLYFIGTMNTADRSIALMDTALRRRFAFTEQRPDPGLLPTNVDGINLSALLVALNDRIEAVFDRDHVIGHSYLMGLESFEDIQARFRNQLIPLLQEYFFEDWQKIRAVFRDTDAVQDLQIVQVVSTPRFDGENASRVFQVNAEIRPAAVKKIYE